MFIVQDFRVLILAPFLLLHYRMIELLLGLNIGWRSLHNACEQNMFADVRTTQCRLGIRSLV